MKLGIESRSGLQDLPWQMCELGLLCELGVHMKNQELGLHAKLKIGNQESRDSHTSQEWGVPRLSHESRIKSLGNFV